MDRRGPKKTTKIMCQGYGANVRCQVSSVICCVLRVNCQPSLTPTATATKPLPANYRYAYLAGLHRPKKKLKRKENLNQLKNKNQRTSKSMPILALCSLTRSL